MRAELLAALALSVSLEASAVSLYADTGELEVTSEGYRVANQSADSRNIVAMNGHLFVAFLGCLAYPCVADGSGNVPGGIRARAYDLGAATWEPSAQTFGNVLFEETTNTGGNDRAYHHTPPLAAQSDGTLIYLANTNAASGACQSGPNSVAPYWRSAPASTWNGPLGTWTDCISGGVSLDTGSSAVDTNDSGVTASGAGRGSSYSTVNDVNPVMLPDGTALFVAETTRPYASSHAGLHASLWRRTAAGAWHGPYVLFHAIGNYTPTATAGVCDNPVAGNVFAKTKLVVRGSTVYAVMAPRANVYSDQTPTTPGRHSYLISAAKSVDGGVTWTDLSGAHPWTPSAVTKDAPAWDDATYRIYTGDMDEYSQDEWDVDSHGRLAVLINRFVSGVSDFCGHADTQASGNTFDLSLLRQTESGWATYTIDASNDWHSQTPVLAFDSSDRIWIVKTSSTFSPTGMAYKVSTDGGVSFSGWTSMTSSNSSRAVPFLDPERRWMAFTYLNSPTRQLYARRVDFTDPPSRCCK